MKKREIEHERELSQLRPVKVMGPYKKCSGCKKRIPKGDKFLFGWDLDQCSHRKRVGESGHRIFNVHKKIQLCLTCAEKPETRKRYKDTHDDKSWESIIHRIKVKNCEECPKVSIEGGAFECHCTLLKKIVDAEGIDEDCPYYKRVMFEYH